MPSPLPAVEHIGTERLAPDALRALALERHTALLYVQFGILAVGGRGGVRALPGEWVLARAVDRFEYANASRTEDLTVCEVHIKAPPGQSAEYVAQRYFSDDEKANQLCAVADEAGQDGALTLGLDASVYIATLGRWSTVLHDLQPGRGAWVFVLDGDAMVNNRKLDSGAGAFIIDHDEVRISGGSGADVILVEAACDTERQQDQSNG